MPGDSGYNSIGVAGVGRSSSSVNRGCAFSRRPQPSTVTRGLDDGQRRAGRADREPGPNVDDDVGAVDGFGDVEPRDDPEPARRDAVGDCERRIERPSGLGPTVGNDHRGEGVHERHRRRERIGALLQPGDRVTDQPERQDHRSTSRLVGRSEQRECFEGGVERHTTGVGGHRPHRRRGRLQQRGREQPRGEVDQPVDIGAREDRHRHARGRNAAVRGTVFHADASPGRGGPGGGREVDGDTTDERFDAADGDLDLRQGGSDRQIDGDRRHRIDRQLDVPGHRSRRQVEAHPGAAGHHVDGAGRPQRIDR